VKPGNLLQQGQEIVMNLTTKKLQGRPGDRTVLGTVSADGNKHRFLRDYGSIMRWRRT
jgi:hypothetical protein